MKILKKLRDDRGASLLLAMVFLLICAFVGGSVLAGATANSRHLKTLAQDQQDYLSQRSAVTLLTDLADTGSRRVQMIVKRTTTYTQPYKQEGNTWVKDGDTTGSAETVEIEVRSLAKNTPYNPIQRLVIECAVLRFAKDEGYPLEAITIKNFLAENGGDTALTITSPSQFWIKDGGGEGTITLTDPLGSQTVTAYAQCDGDYSFNIFFTGVGADSTEDKIMSSQSKLHMSASSSKPSSTGLRDEPPQNVEKGQTQANAYPYETESTTITWSVPIVSKGGHRA